MIASEIINCLSLTLNPSQLPLQLVLSLRFSALPLGPSELHLGPFQMLLMPPLRPFVDFL